MYAVRNRGIYSLTTREQAEKAQQKILKEKWCGGCSSHQKLETGKFILGSHGIKRWVCEICLKRILDRRKS